MEWGVICAATPMGCYDCDSWGGFGGGFGGGILGGIARAGFSHRESALPDPLNY
jgi:hypothetical protein